MVIIFPDRIDMKSDGSIARLRRVISGTDLKERSFSTALLCLVERMLKQQPRTTLAAEIRMRTDLINLEFVNNKSGENERAERSINGAAKQEMEGGRVRKRGSDIFFRPRVLLTKCRQGKQFHRLDTRRRSYDKLSRKERTIAYFR